MISSTIVWKLTVLGPIVFWLIIVPLKQFQLRFIFFQNHNLQMMKNEIAEATGQTGRKPWHSEDKDWMEKYASAHWRGRSAEL
jgi:hypothetical protein